MSSINDSSSGDKFRRITISIDVVNEKIVENLEGIKGTSKSKVINNIIEEWVEQNYDKIMNIWNIDLIGIRTLAQTSYKGIDVDKILKELDKKLIDLILKMFKRIDSISINELAKTLKVHEDTIKNIIFFQGDILEKNGLNLRYKDGYIIN
ncbi:MAG: hypothetical protein ACTSQJ_15630 [Promethearchaeota archaeon]